MKTWIPYGLIIRQLGAIIIAIAIPLIIGGVVPAIQLRSMDQVFIGVLVYITATVSGLSYDIVRLLEDRKKAEPIEKIQSTFDLHLHNIHASFRQIVQHARIEGDLFTSYYTRIIERIDDAISQAAAKRELSVNEMHLPMSEVLLQCFTGRPTDSLRLVHHLEQNEFMMDVWSRGYYGRIVQKVKEKKIRNVRRIFVFTDRKQLEDPISKRLLDFHVRHPGYDCRVVSDADFKKFMRDAMIETLDFGIYGNLYAYETKHATSQRIEGIFTSAPNRVRAFTEVFDNCWQHGTKPNPSTSATMSLFELFEGVEPPKQLSDMSQPSKT